MALSSSRPQRLRPDDRRAGDDPLERLGCDEDLLGAGETRVDEDRLGAGLGV